MAGRIQVTFCVRHQIEKRQRKGKKSIVNYCHICSRERMNKLNKTRNFSKFRFVCMDCGEDFPTHKFIDDKVVGEIQCPSCESEEIYTQEELRKMGRHERN